MPTYQYKCRECQHELEAVQSFTDQPRTECPVCGGPLRKVFSTVGVVFKGSGFYRNDSRAAAGKDNSEHKSDGAADKRPAAKADGKADGKTSTAGSEGTSSSGSEGKPASKPTKTDSAGASSAPPPSTTSKSA